MKKIILLTMISFLSLLIIILIIPIITTKASLYSYESSLYHNEVENKTYVHGTYIIRTNSIYNIHNLDVKIEIYNDNNELIKYEYLRNQNNLVKYRVSIPNDIGEVNVKYKITSLQYTFFMTFDIIVVLMLILSCYILILVLIKEFTKKIIVIDFTFETVYYHLA